MADAGKQSQPTGMSADHWQQVKDLLSKVLEVELSQRPVFLEQLCMGQEWLRSEVESLLTLDTEASDELLDSPLMTDVLHKTARIGRRIGPYQIVEEIGIGGMGEVYRAFRADDQYRKQVAIKLVRAGQDSSFVIDRFKSERQVLATLDHPNIAHLLDGGTTEDGLPYFVMELIEGQPVNEYCKSHGLETKGRLQLFLQVCSAVQYAHQRLIVHRDLKPSNILVTAEGSPRLLDFGIAKILNPAERQEGDDPTVSVFRLLTPAYASPEQIKGEPITTASDVYSLGVLLYELLTGHQPYENSCAAPHEIARAVCEFEPRKPSSVAWRPATHDPVRESAGPPPGEGSQKLRKQLRGDLDNIVLMALRKEPLRRYASVEQFADDIRRHLEKLPVKAARATFRYRAAKFVTRNRTGVGAAVVVVSALLIGLGTTLYEARQARRQQQLAERRFNDVRELANSLMFDVHDSIQDLPGSTPARKLLVERALRYLDRLSHDAASEVSLRREMATAYEKIGTVQGNPFGANLGDIDGAVQSYRKALILREALAKGTPINVDDLVALAHCQRLFAATVSNQVQEQENSAANTGRELQALATAKRAFELAPANPAVLQELQLNYDLLFTLSHYSGNFQEAWDYLQSEWPIIQSRLQAAPTDRGLQFAMGKAEAKAGQELSKLGFPQEAVDHLRRSIQIFESLSADGTDANARRYLAYAHDRFGDVQLNNGDVSSALQSYKKEVAILEPLRANDPRNAVMQLDLASALAKQGNALALNGDMRSGMGLLARSITMLQSQIQRDPSYSEPLWSLAWSRIWMAEVSARAGEANTALEEYRKVLDMWERKGDPLVQTIVAGIDVKIGDVYFSEGKESRAREEFKNALDIAGRMLTSAPYMLEARYVRADAYSGLGKLSERIASSSAQPVSERRQHWTEGRTFFQQSAEEWKHIHNPGARTPMGLACGSPAGVVRAVDQCNAALANLR
jgi:non-specific serine/threonine protein kinase/serine/threonine-protein kinase